MKKLSIGFNRISIAHQRNESLLDVACGFYPSHRYLFRDLKLP